MTDMSPILDYSREVSRKTSDMPKNRLLLQLQAQIFQKLAQYFINCRLRPRFLALSARNLAFDLLSLQSKILHSNHPWSLFFHLSGTRSVQVFCRGWELIQNIPSIKLLKSFSDAVSWQKSFSGPGLNKNGPEVIINIQQGRRISIQ